MKDRGTKQVFKGIIGWFRRDVKVAKQGVQPPLKEESEQILVEIGREVIQEILPHKGKMLLLDRVVITPLEVMGEFTVTEEVCEGHAMADGQPVFKGSDIFDMAAQLTGMWASQHPEFKGRKAAVRRYGEAKLQGFIFPGDLLTLSTRVNNFEGVVTTRERLPKILITGRNFSAKVQDVQKAHVSFVELLIF